MSTPVACPLMTTPAELFRVNASPDPGRPFLTYYDDADGARVELSWTTTANAVAKTANLVLDELGAEPGERVALWLPTHWQTVVWYLACWSAGVVAAPGLDPAQADYAVAGPDAIEATAGCSGPRVLVGLHPMGLPGPPPPPGVFDHARLGPGQPDQFVGGPVDADGPALARSDVERSGRELCVQAAAAAAGWGLDRSSRVLLTGGLDTEAGLMAGLLAPLAAGAAVVLVSNPDPAREAERVAAERITHRLPAG
ncbi:MAG: TIGR03089 family protein [Sporichthyaceae bacterium]